MIHLIVALLALLVPATAAPADPERPERPERGVVAGVVGEWETATPLGGTLVIGPLNGRDHLLYAVQAPEGVRISTGLRQGDRLLRTAVVLQSDAGLDLYGGDRLDQGEYRLLGAVPGTPEVEVAGPDGSPRPVSATSTEVLPGWTVFVDRAPWGAGWDPLQLAPLEVTAGDERAAVREVSWTG